VKPEKFKTEKIDVTRRHGSKLGLSNYKKKWRQERISGGELNMGSMEGGIYNKNANDCPRDLRKNNRTCPKFIITQTKKQKIGPTGLLVRLKGGNRFHRKDYYKESQLSGWGGWKRHLKSSEKWGCENRRKPRGMNGFKYYSEISGRRIRCGHSC